MSQQVYAPVLPRSIKGRYIAGLLALLLYVPFYSSLIPVNQSLLNLGSALGSTILLIVVSAQRFLRLGAVVALLLWAIILVGKAFQTGFSFNMTDGVATAVRYFLYALVVVTLSGSTTSRFDLKRFFDCCYSLALFSIVVGIATNNYVFINEMLRFKGATHSPAALALQLSVALLFILIDFYKSRNERWRASEMPRLAILCILFAVFTWALMETGSRQPLMGLIFVSFLYSLFTFTKLTLLSLTLLITFAAPLTSNITDNRLWTTGTKIYDSGGLQYLGELKDGSIRSRLDYIEIGVAHVNEENPLFGAGLNSFPGIYEQARSKEGVAAHNDILLIFVEFGYAGLVIALLVVVNIVRRSVLRKEQLPILILGLWAVGLSLNNPLYYHAIPVSLLAVLCVQSAQARVLTTKNAPVAPSHDLSYR